MYNINMYQFQEKPYCNSGDYYIFPLNNSGIEKYKSKEGHPALYLNRLNPTIFQQIVSKGLESTETTIRDQRTDDSNKPIPQNTSAINISLTEKEPKLSISNNKASTITINDELNRNKYQHRSSTHQHHKPAYPPKGNYIMPFELRLKQQKQYFSALHKRMNFEDIFGYPEPTKKNTKNEIYEGKISSLKENLTTQERSCGNSNNSSMCISKSINGGISIPRVDRKTDKKVSPIFNSLAMHLNRSLSIPHCNILNDNESINNVLKKNNALKETLNQQTNKVFLQKTKLPPLSKVISTKQVVSKSIGNLKNLGPKYNPDSYTNNSYGKFARNYVGGIYNY